MATVPEFRQIINKAFRDAHINDQSLEDVQFISKLPYLLDLENKLLLARNLLGFDMTVWSEWSDKVIHVARYDPWLSIVQHLHRQRDASTPRYVPWHESETQRRDLRNRGVYRHLVPNSDDSDLLHCILRENITFQFGNEIGIGRGVEREVFELISVSLVRGSMRIFKSLDKDSSKVIPIYDNTFIQLNEEDEIDGNTSQQDRVFHSSQVNRSKNSRIPPASHSKVPVNSQSSSSYSNRLQSLTQTSDDSDDSGDDMSSDESSVKEDEAKAEHENESSIDGIDVAADPNRDFDKYDSEQSQCNWRKTYPDKFREQFINDINKHSTLSSLYFFGQFVGHILLRHIGAQVYCISNPSGRSSGKSTTMLSLDIPHSFWNLVLRREITLDDVAEFDIDIHRNLQYLKNNSNVEELSLTFTAILMEDGLDDNIQPHIVDLIPNGAAIDVTDNNKSLYIQLMTDHCIAGRMSIQADYIRAGMLSIFSKPVLRLFTGRELTSLISGTCIVSVEDWISNTKYGGYDDSICSHRNLKNWFWEYVSELSQSDLSLLLQFSTGCSRLPTGGFKSFHPLFTIQIIPYEEKSSLPKSSTCFNLLKLPEYPERNILRKCMTTAILYGSQGFSYS